MKNTVRVTVMLALLLIGGGCIRSDAPLVVATDDVDAVTDVDNEGDDVGLRRYSCDEACDAVDGPVCATVEIQCITTPCDPIEETFASACAACKNGLVRDYILGECQEVPPLDEETARELVIEHWGDCGARESCDSLSAELLILEGTYRIIGTYEGLHDDSVQAMRYEAQVDYDARSGAWVAGEPDVLWKCQPERGSQEWTTELCI